VGTAPSQALALRASHFRPERALFGGRSQAVDDRARPLGSIGRWALLNNLAEPSGSRLDGPWYNRFVNHFKNHFIYERYIHFTTVFIELLV
jgi:hypothetical protein